MPEFIDVDPAALHLPSSRLQGADAMKLAKQVAKHGTSLVGMPPILLVRGMAGKFRINDGVTRATRAAKYQPGVRIPAEVIQTLPNLDVSRTPTVRETLP